MGFAVGLHLVTDATAAVGVMRREGVGKIRHLSVRCLWLQQVVREKRIIIDKIETSSQPADLGTKPHYRARLGLLKGLCGIMDEPPQVPEEASTVGAIVPGNVDGDEMRILGQAIVRAMLGRT